MKSFVIILLTVLTLSSSYGTSDSDSLYLKIDYVESPDLLEFFRFERIDFNKIQIIGENIKDKNYLLTSLNFEKGNLTKVDTLSYLKQFGMKNNSDTLNIKIMSKKINPDTVKFQFNNLGITSLIREYKTTQENYSLRVIQGSSFHKDQPIDLLAYTLPVARSFQGVKVKAYCVLTDDGVKPEEWWDKYGVEHVIVFRFQLVD